MIKPTFAIVLGVLAPGVEMFSTAQKLYYQSAWDRDRDWRYGVE